MDAILAMGTTVQLELVGGDDELRKHLIWRLGQLEANWSRFLPDSEVNALNRRAGEWVYVCEETLELVEKAAFAAEMTQGAFNPLMLDPLVKLGYDRTFGEIEHVGAAEVNTWVPAASPLQVDRANGAVMVPAGYGFDPGGIGKGLAADILAREAIERGADGALVNIGGDLRVVGTPPAGDAWGIKLHEPAAGVALPEVVALPSGAVATSTTKKRTWGPGVHHLLDAVTGQPLQDQGQDDIVLVTVIAAEAWWADAVTKAIFSHDCPDLPGVAILRVTASGEIEMSEAFAQYLTTEVAA